MSYENDYQDPDFSSEQNSYVNGEYRFGRIPQDGPDAAPDRITDINYASYTNNGFYGSYGEPEDYEDYSYSEPGEYGLNEDTADASSYRSEPRYDYFESTDNPAKKTKKRGGTRKAVAILLSVLMLGLAAGGGYLAAKGLASKGQAQNSFSRKELGSGESLSESTPQTTENKPGESEWKLTTKSYEEVADKGIKLDVSTVAGMSLPAVVAITKTSVQEIQNHYSMWGYGFGDGGSTHEVNSAGSGIIIGQSETDLLIVTNHHVIEGANSLSVSFCDDSVYDATVKGSDSGVDIALVYVKLADLTDETKNNIAVVSIGDSDTLKIGEQVVAIGNALGHGQSVTTGIVSALNRSVTTSTAPLLQTDAAINPGNSGGALLNMQGELIGINSAKYASTEVEGMGYAIPISTVIPIVERIQNKVQRSAVSDENACYIGISGQDVNSYTAAMYGMPVGVYLVKITENGPFEKAGIKAGGVLIGFDDEEVTTMQGLKELLTYYAAGETVTVVISELEDNNYVSHEYQVTLGNASEMQNETLQPDEKE